MVNILLLGGGYVLIRIFAPVVPICRKRSGRRSYCRLVDGMEGHAVRFNFYAVSGPAICAGCKITIFCYGALNCNFSGFQLQLSIHTDVFSHRTKRGISIFPHVINYDGCFSTNFAPAVEIV